MGVRAKVNWLWKSPSLQIWDVLSHCKIKQEGPWVERVSLQPLSSLKELEIPLQALQRFSETDFKFIQPNWSKYCGYIQQDCFAPLLNQFSLIGLQDV